jgi:hypothetical protein
MVHTTTASAAARPVCRIITLRPCTICREHLTGGRFCTQCAPACRICGAQRLGEDLSVPGACCACEHCGEAALHRERVQPGNSDSPLVCPDCIRDSTLRCTECGIRHLDIDDEIGYCTVCEDSVCSECSGVCRGCGGWRCGRFECQGTRCFQC